jgi:hypothetical protein
MRTLGIPYAFADFDRDGCLVRVCPECGTRLREATDADGEQVSTVYADHYAAEHSETGTPDVDVCRGCGSSLPSEVPARDVGDLCFSCADVAMIEEMDGWG